VSPSQVSTSGLSPFGLSSQVSTSGVSPFGLSTQVSTSGVSPDAYAHFPPTTISGLLANDQFPAIATAFIVNNDAGNYCSPHRGKTFQN